METAEKIQANSVSATAAHTNAGSRTLPAVPVLQRAKMSTLSEPETLTDAGVKALPAVSVLQPLTRFNPVQRKENKTGLPDHLKASVETLSGYDMNDVNVHYNSPKPMQFRALAYAQGTDIHIAPGQERHLPHEAWHVVQQKQGRVQPTLQMKEGIPVNDDAGLESEADLMGNKAMTADVHQMAAPALITTGTTSAVQLSSVQFTLEDAQALWLQWYKSPNASRQKITDYIDARKRGAAKLRYELDKRAPDIQMGGDEESENSNDMEVSENIVEELKVHDEDSEEYANIIKKQSERVGDSETKHETDRRKLGSLYRLLGKEKGDQQLMLNLFFKKNAPAGYNRSEEVEENEFEREFDPHYERDFTFGLPQELTKDERTQTDYFRTTTSESHKHVNRKRMDNGIRSFMIKKYPGKKDQIRQKQVYMSFYVQYEDNNQETLKILSASDPYESPNMLGANASDKSSVVRRKVNINGQSLTLWINSKSVGQQSKYNASAIVPNFMQYTQIMQALGIKNEVDVDLENEVPEKSFHSITKKLVHGAEGIEEPASDYKAKMLSDRRTLIKMVSDTINKTAKGKYIRAITADMSQGFLQYPCLILEPLPDFKKDFELNSDSLIDELKIAIVNLLHKSFDISFGNRASFGFAYPTVGDVGASVRIWPGLINHAIFSEIIFKTLHKAELLPSAPESIPYEDKKTKSPLAEALTMAIGRARERYQRYQDLKGQGKTDKSKELYKWVINRITSNIIKATELIRLLEEAPSNLEFTKRAVRVLENLNEYDLIQAGAEEQQHKDEPNRSEELLNAFRLPVMNKKVPGWDIVCVKLRSSGMDAYRAALEIVGDAQKESSRLYFETAKVNHEIKSNVTGMEKVGSITKMMDPSYNFVSQSDVERKNPFTWKPEKNFPTVHIYDITNTTIDDAFSKIDNDNKPDFAIFFESMSKHFQFGMDKTTIGRLIVYINPESNDQTRVEKLKARAEQTSEASGFPKFFLNYLALQNKFYGI